MEGGGAHGAGGFHGGNNNGFPGPFAGGGGGGGPFPGGFHGDGQGQGPGWGGPAQGQHMALGGGQPMGHGGHNMQMQGGPLWNNLGQHQGGSFNGSGGFGGNQRGGNVGFMPQHPPNGFQFQPPTGGFHDGVAQGFGGNSGASNNGMNRFDPGYGAPNHGPGRGGPRQRGRGRGSRGGRNQGGRGGRNGVADNTGGRGQTQGNMQAPVVPNAKVPTGPSPATEATAAALPKVLAQPKQPVPSHVRPRDAVVLKTAHTPDSLSQFEQGQTTDLKDCKSLKFEMFEEQENFDKSKKQKSDQSSNSNVEPQKEGDASKDTMQEGEDTDMENDDLLDEEWIVQEHENGEVSVLGCNTQTEVSDGNTNLGAEANGLGLGSCGLSVHTRVLGEGAAGTEELRDIADIAAYAPVTGVATETVPGSRAEEALLIQGSDGIAALSNGAEMDSSEDGVLLGKEALGIQAGGAGADGVGEQQARGPVANPPASALAVTNGGFMDGVTADGALAVETPIATANLTDPSLALGPLLEMALNKLKDPKGKAPVVADGDGAMDELATPTMSIMQTNAHSPQLRRSLRRQHTVDEDSIERASRLVAIKNLEATEGVDAVHPRVAAAVASWGGGVVGAHGRHVAERAPDGAVALEPGAEADLPHAVAAADASLGLGVGELVPERAAGRVAEAVQRALAGLHVAVAQPQASLHLLQHGAAAGVHAEVLERAPEVRDVRPDFTAAEQAAEDEGLEELELLRQREDERAERGDVGLERVAGDGHELPRQGDAHPAALVLALVHAPEALVPCALVRAHRVEQPVLGPARVRPLVGQQRRRAAHAEDAVGQQHGAVVAEVPVERDVLGAHHHGERVRVRLQHVPGEVDGDETRAAAHAAERFTTMDASDGVGLKRLQLTTRTPTSRRGSTPVAANSASRHPNMTASASARASAIDSRGGRAWMPGGRYVRSPSPERRVILVWKSSASALKNPVLSVMSRNPSLEMACSSPGR
ncbi:hypothetical protein EJB05_22845, partial [Eragrostis curvula]